MSRFLPISLSLLLGAAPALTAGTPLSKAVISGRHADVLARLDGGEKVNEFDKWGWTPLMWSIYYRTTPITRLLLEKGANPNLLCGKPYGNIPSGATALTVAAYYGMEEECTLLLKVGARADLVDDKGTSPLGYAQKFQFHAVEDLLAQKPEGAPPVQVATTTPPATPGSPATLPPGPIKLPSSVNGTRLAKVYPKVMLVPFTTTPAIADDYPGAMAEAQQGALEAFRHYKAFDKALLKEPISGKVLREQELNTENSVWGAAFTFGYSDRSMPRDIGAIVAAYVVAVGGQPLS